MKVKTKGKEYDVAEPVGNAIKDMKDKIDNLQAQLEETDQDEEVLMEGDQDEELAIEDEDLMMEEDQDEELMLGDQDPMLEEDQDEELMLGDMGGEHEEDQGEELMMEEDQDILMEEDQDEELMALEDSLEESNFQNKMQDHNDAMDIAKRVLSKRQLRKINGMRADDIKRVVVVASSPNINKIRLDSNDYLNVRFDMIAEGFRKSDSALRNAGRGILNSRLDRKSESFDSEDVRIISMKREQESVQKRMDAMHEKEA